MQTRPLLSRIGGVAALLVAGLAWFLTQGQTARALDLQAYADREASAQVCGHAEGLDGPEIETLVRFGEEQGLKYPYAFAQVTAYLWLTGELPECYMTKNEASGQGWKSAGTTIDDIDKDGAIGGNTFGNREGRLPQRPRNRYVEADLDYVRGNRGAARIVYDRELTDRGFIWVTVDHYDSFKRIPEL